MDHGIGKVAEYFDWQFMIW